MDLFGLGLCLSFLVLATFEITSPSSGKDAKSADAEATKRDDNLNELLRRNKADLT